MSEHLGYRYERHMAHLAATKAVQRRGQLERIDRAIAELRGHNTRGAGLAQDSDTLGLLIDMRADVVAQMEAADQQP